MRWLLFLCGSINALYLPEGVPVDSEYDMNQGSELEIPLLAATPLPDKNQKGGQLNWPIYISPDTFGNENRFDDIVVNNVILTLRGLYHESSGDLVMKLAHQGIAVTLSENRGETRRFGIPANRDYAKLSNHREQRTAFGESVLSGIGFDYEFGDLVGNNLAFEKPGEQISSMAGDATASWRGTDGDIYSSGVATHSAFNPWYQVDLGSVRNIRTIVLWTPDPEKPINEIQIVKTVGLITLGGTFRLQLMHNGFTETTVDISHDAVAAIENEDPSSEEAGQSVGESMQSKLQGLENIGLVSVTRNTVDHTGGYEWTITFLTEHTNLNQLEVNMNNLTAGKLRLPEDQVSSIEITTEVNGTFNTYYNGNMKYGVILVSEIPFGNVDLDAARAIAHQETNFDIKYGQRQINIPMPTNVAGRYIRIALRQFSYLSISEILVFEEEFYSMQVFPGGSPFPAGRYAPENALGDAFIGKKIYGEWLLSVEDTATRNVKYEDKAHRRVMENGVGAMSDWVLQLTTTNTSSGDPGPDLMFFVDMTATILTLPKFGSLYMAEDYMKGNLVLAQQGGLIHTGICAPMDCNHKFGIGNILSTNQDGSVAAPNKIGFDRKVIYVPNPDFIGVDEFKYRMNVGTYKDPRQGKITIRVKRCRLNCDNDRLFGFRPAVNESIATPWDNHLEPSYPPDRVLQPEKYGNKLWNDPYCDTPPCNIYDNVSFKK